MPRLLRYLLFALLWGALVAYFVAASLSARRVKGERRVKRLEVSVVDSSSLGQLVTSQQVREWIARSGIKTLGEQVDSVDLRGLEALIARNGFVERAVAYTTYEGSLHLDIHQRKPLLRLLCDGRNRYVTADGYLFDAPHTSSLYTPVVTGNYAPPAPASWVGDVRRYIDTQLEAMEEQIAQLERKKLPLFRGQRQAKVWYDSLRRMPVKRRWIPWERKERYEERLDSARKARRQLRRPYRYKLRELQTRITQLEQEQLLVGEAQKKLEKNYEDFMNLLNFVDWVERDDFWRSEVVQIVAQTTPSGALEVNLIPRSGEFVVRFGRLEAVEEKFDRLLRFYRSGLSVLGWSTYREIDLRFDEQVVCRK